MVHLIMKFRNQGKQGYFPKDGSIPEPFYAYFQIISILADVYVGRVIPVAF